MTQETGFSFIDKRHSDWGWKLSPQNTTPSECGYWARILNSSNPGFCP